MKPVKHFGWIFRLMRVLFASALFIIFITPAWALAQSTGDPWDKPLNLSRSGAAINPDIVTDSEGVVHVVWQDDLANFVYTRFDGDQWSAPVTTSLNVLFRRPLANAPRSPNQVAIYTGPNPLFMAGPGGYIFAFWLTPQGRLFTSKVKNQAFDHIAAWDPEGLITSKAASFAVTVDARGEWHLAFLRTIADPRNPVGIYYTHSKNGGWTWTLPVLLYTSPYLQTLAEGEENLSLATAEMDDTLRVYVAWDNRPRKQVFLAQSSDGGKSWEQPALVASPAPDAGLAGPSNIQVGADKNSIVLVWQNGRATNGLLPSCSQIFEFSGDAGATWSDPQSMIEDMVGCAQSNKFVTGLA